MINTAPCIMFWMRAYPLRGEVGGDWALEFESFLGPVKWHRADRGVPFGAQKTQEFKGRIQKYICQLSSERCRIKLFSSTTASQKYLYMYCI
jgi:hypothetical protein